MCCVSAVCVCACVCSLCISFSIFFLCPSLVTPSAACSSSPVSSSSTAPSMASRSNASLYSHSDRSEHSQRCTSDTDHTDGEDEGGEARHTAEAWKRSGRARSRRRRTTASTAADRSVAGMPVDEQGKGQGQPVAVEGGRIRLLLAATVTADTSPWASWEGSTLQLEERTMRAVGWTLPWRRLRPRLARPSPVERGVGKAGRASACEMVLECMMRLSSVRVVCVCVCVHGVGSRGAADSTQQRVQVLCCCSRCVHRSYRT